MPQTDKNLTASQLPDAPGRPWLDELTARYGDPGVHAGPTPLGRFSDADGRYQRECWAWFPPCCRRNHNMALDQYAGHWVIRADGYPGCGHLAQVRVRWPGADEPPAEVIRAALVSAGLLPAEHAMLALLADRAGLHAVVTLKPENDAPEDGTDE